MVPFSKSIRGFFPDIHYKDLADLLEIKLTKIWGPPYLGSLEFLIHRLAHTEPPAIGQLQFRFSYPSPALISEENSVQPVSALVSYDSPHLPVSPIFGVAVCPVTVLLWWA